MKCAILISLYNAANTLDKTFESLRSQTFQDFRIIAIDDVSDDETPKLLKKWQEIFGEDRFLIINNEKNAGLTKSLNRGLAAITEPYTARIDADDWWHPEKLRKQMTHVETHLECGLIGTWYKNITSRATKTITLPETDVEIRKNIFKRNPFAHSCVMFRTALVKQHAGYDESIRYGQDYDLWLRLLPHTKVHNLPEFLCYRSIDRGISLEKQRSQMWQCIKTQVKYIRKYRCQWHTYLYLLEPILVILTPNFIKTLKRKVI